MEKILVDVFDDGISKLNWNLNLDTVLYKGGVLISHLLASNSRLKEVCDRGLWDRSRETLEAENEVEADCWASIPGVVEGQEFMVNLITGRTVIGGKSISDNDQSDGREMNNNSQSCPSKSLQTFPPKALLNSTLSDQFSSLTKVTKVSKESKIDPPSSLSLNRSPPPLPPSVKMKVLLAPVMTALAGEEWYMGGAEGMMWMMKIKW